MFDAPLNEVLNYLERRPLLRLATMPMDWPCLRSCLILATPLRTTLLHFENGCHACSWGDRYLLLSDVVRRDTGKFYNQMRQGLDTDAVCCGFVQCIAVSG